MENMAAAIIQQLSGNPLTTPIGQKIEQATDASLPAEDWNLNMLICDMINDTDEGPKDAVRAIRRLLQQNAGKNHTAIMYTLTVLETCVKNCGRRFHLLVTNKDFVQELVKLIGPKNDPPLILQSKVLSIIETWTNAFRGQPDLAGVVHVYNDLKSKSIEFPTQNYEQLAPIHTPQRSVRIQPPANHISLYQQAVGVNPQQQQQLPFNQINNSTITARMTGPIVLNEEQLAKLKAEMQIVNGNIKVFSEMLTELDKSTSNLNNEDLELLHELNGTCLQMQKRIVELLDKVSNEEVTSELLTINDSLNTLFTRYEIYSNKNQQQPQIQQRQLLTNKSNNNNNNIAVRPKTSQEAASLIDFKEAKDSNLVANQLENLTLNQAIGGDNQASNGQQSMADKLNQLKNKPPHQAALAASGDTDFDEFAQLRSEKRIIDGLEINEQEVDEMKRWLEEQQQQNSVGTTEQPASLSNTEFDNFLAARLNNLEKNQPAKKSERDESTQNLLD